MTSTSSGVIWGVVNTLLREEPEPLGEEFRDVPSVVSGDVAHVGNDVRNVVILQRILRVAGRLEGILSALTPPNVR
jgi:hypothetical protein